MNLAQSPTRVRRSTRNEQNTSLLSEQPQIRLSTRKAIKIVKEDEEKYDDQTPLTEDAQDDDSVHESGSELVSDISSCLKGTDES